MDSHYAQQQPKPFLGVRFVLFGFTSINEHQVKSKLVNGGGVDVGQYSQDSTHVIVDKLVYDDPVCVAAREDSKILVTGLWVDHSFDIGMPVDHTSIMYRPLKDLNGIPGAKSFIMCLTGYQRQDRDDVMTMVGLMGAQFSKPLVANKVTHLICYKFEGEKYELAKKMKKIHLVNHKWLEDCLSYWQVLPEANYSKSGYELEMETEAKDSEEEAEDNIAMQFRGRKMNLSPHSIQVGMPRAHELHTSVGVMSKIPLDTTVSIGPSIRSVVGKDTSSGLDTSLNNVFEKHHEELGCQKTHVEPPDHYDGTPIYTKVGNDLTSTSASANKSPHSGVGKLSGMSYSRKTPRSTLQSEISARLTSSPKLQSGERKNCKAEQAVDRSDSTCFNTPSKASGILHEEEFNSLSRQKRKMDASCPSSKSQKMGHGSIPCISVGPSANNEVQRSESTPLIRGPSEITEVLSVEINGLPQDEPALLNSAKRSPGDTLRTKSSSYRRRSLKSNLPVSEIGLDSSAENARQHLVRGPSEITEVLSVENNGIPQDEPALLNSAKHSPGDMLRTKSSSYRRRSLKSNLPISEIGLDSNVENARQHSVERLEESAFACKPRTMDAALGRSVHEVGGIGELQKWQQDADASSPKYRTLEFAKSHSPVTHMGEDDASHLKPVEKMVSKKSLGSRPKLGTSCKTNTANRKGSIYLDKTASQNDAAVYLVGGKGTESHEEPCSADKLEVPSCLDKIETLMEMNPRDAPKPGNDIENKNESMDDETEAPDDKIDELEKAVNQRSEGAEVTLKPDVMMDETSEGGHHITKASTDNAMASEEDREKVVYDKDIKLGESTFTTDAVGGKISKGKKRPLGKNKINAVRAVTKKNLEDDRKKTSTDNETTFEGDHEKVVDGDIELGESTSTTDAVRRKMTKAKKRPLGKNKTNTVRAVGKNLEDERNVAGDDTGTEKIIEKLEMEKRGPNEAAKTQSNMLSVNKLDNTMELEKENKPMIIGEKSMGGNEQCVGELAVKSGTKKKVAVKSNRTALKTNQKAGKIDPDSLQPGGSKEKVKAEPMWFILSGHRLQRKEFQKIIRQLRGRICRDSHHWSYQATHFIVPDPIKRTEKFLAAAASGRWILNSDYLSASSQAGKFLAEKPYEWHKNGLSEDGAINLEAPRKWRLLREKTGHGAFYGMRIIIYGECIAPPLDTLKRAVKAGDGTILATSPPYTRFLSSGVDFAVVSPGMPRVDIWVQEFLKHEIPCVVADYLVEYVCKTGYSLERHVQYNTQAWAEKSFANQMSRLEEIVEDLTPPNDHRENDITCQVCRSSDRGEVMLICGDESGSIGCGIGIHIDCCNPPLEEVPEEDWFCPSCRSKNSSSTPKNSKKRPYKSK